MKVTNIFVSNLLFRINEDQLRSEFEKFGEVSSVKIIREKESRRSKGAMAL